MNRRIYLIGFMGSGKSFAGRRLAGELGLPFLDLDLYLEEKAGRTIFRIFEEAGETAFRKMEAAALRETERFSAAVIACGGGTPCFGGNMEWMNAHGLTIYLETPVELLVERLISETAHRPLLHGLDRPGLRRYIEEKLAQRAPYYRRASVIMHQTPDKSDDLVRELIDHLADITGH
jgi:shikimate kinase